MTTGEAINEQRAAAVSLPRRRFIDDMPDKGLFAGVATFGFALILFLKIQLFSPEIVATFAVAMMIVYGSIAYRIPAVSLRLDRLGDNFYYLGFIYTLASLSAALVELRTGINSTAILGAFGVALITTIVGIAGRVIFVQMRSEIDTVEEEIRREIAEASSRLKGELSAALNDLDTFRTGVRQASVECLNENAAYAKANIHQISAVTQAAASKISEAFEQNHTAAQQTLELVSKTSSAVAQLITRIDAAELGTARAHIEQISSVAQQAAARIDEAFTAKQSQAQALTKAITKATSAIDKFATRIESADVPTAEAHIQQISSVAQQAATRIDAAFAEKSAGMRALLDVMARTSSVVERFIQRLETSKLPTEELETGLKSFTTKLDSLLERFGATVTAVAQRMTAENRRQHWWSRS
jgi:hypothetical protein